LVESHPPAPSADEWHDDFVPSDSLITRLYRADEQTVLDVIGPLTPQQRAGVAAYCYRRSHMHSVGLAIAATCEQQTLMQVLGTAVGTVLFSQSRHRHAPADRTPGSHRPKITLAKVQADVSPRELNLDDPNQAGDEPDHIDHPIEEISAEHSAGHAG
jgi:hypothetical protein